MSARASGEVSECSRASLPKSRKQLALHEKSCLYLIWFCRWRPSVRIAIFSPAFLSHEVLNCLGEITKSFVPWTNKMGVSWSFSYDGPFAIRIDALPLIYRCVHWMPVSIK